MILHPHDIPYILPITKTFLDQKHFSRSGNFIALTTFPGVGSEGFPMTFSSMNLFVSWFHVSR